MPKLSLFLSFFAVMVALMGGSHALVWWRLVGQTHLPLGLTLAATVLLITGFMGIPLALAFGRHLPAGWSDGPLLVAYVYMGAFFYLFLAAAATGLLQLGWGAVAPAVGPHLQGAGHALLLARTMAAITLLTAALATAIGLANVRRGPRVVHTTVFLARLPAAFDGLRVAQISDLHVARLLRRSYVERVVAKTAAERPDLIVYTGDLVDGSVADLQHDIAPLGQLHAPLGSYAITGNHEYYAGVTPWLAHYQTLGMHLLRNERVSIGKDGAAFDLVGIDDWTAHAFGEGHGADLAKALAGRDSQRCLLLLAHQPRAAAEAQAAGVDLLLSGHTHGGQLWPFGYAVRAVQPFLRGLGRLQNMQVYVNPGTGYWGPPMRVGAPAEISILTLRRAPTAEAS